MKTDGPKDHLHIDRQNLEAHKECYLRHNGLIGILKDRN